MASLPSSSVNYYLHKRHLPSAQIERVPDIDELDVDGSVGGESATELASSLRAANFLPPGMDLGDAASTSLKYASLSPSSLFSPVYTQLSRINTERLKERSHAAQTLRRKLMRGSNVLIVQGGYSGKTFIYDRLAQLGVQVTIMDGPDSYWKLAVEEGKIAAFVELDFSEAGTIFERAMDAVFALDTKFDAVTTYYEDAVPLATRISHALGIVLNPIEACDAARNKRHTRQIMRQAGLPTPAFHSIMHEQHLTEAVANVGFPAVLKPAFGAASLGVHKVTDEAEARRMYNEIKKVMRVEVDPIWAQGTEVILEEFYDGDEFDIDLLLCDGECVYAKLSDNWACWEPWFQETGMNSPSFYPEATQAELVQLAVDTTLALGFKYGAFHVEAKQTSRGPRLIEINARMGGVAVRDSNLVSWGVDLVEEHCLAMLRIPIRPLVSPKARHVFVSVGLNAPFDGVVNSSDWLEHLRKDARVSFVEYEKSAGDRVCGPESGMPDWLAEVRAEFDDHDEFVAWVSHNLAEVEVPVDADDENSRRAFFLPLHMYPFVEPFAPSSSASSP